MAAAMEDAVRKLRDGERAMKARAEASERLSGEIVASLTSGLLVVDGDGIVRTLNPAGQIDARAAGRTGWEGPYRDVLKDVGPLADVLEECLSDVATGRAPGGAADGRRRVASRSHRLADSRRKRAAPRTASSACSAI